MVHKQRLIESNDHVSTDFRDRNECGSGNRCQEIERETNIFIGVIDTEHRDHIRRQFGKDIAFFDEDGDLNYFEINLTYPINCECARQNSQINP